MAKKNRNKASQEARRTWSRKKRSENHGQPQDGFEDLPNQAGSIMAARRWLELFRHSLSLLLTKLSVLFGLTKGEETDVCVVCMDQAPSMMILPCRHANFCADCAEELQARAADVFGTGRRCPICRGPFHSVQEVPTMISRIRQIYHQLVGVIMGPPKKYRRLVYFTPYPLVSGSYGGAFPTFPEEAKILLRDILGDGRSIVVLENGEEWEMSDDDADVIIGVKPRQTVKQEFYMLRKALCRAVRGALRGAVAIFICLFVSSRWRPQNLLDFLFDFLVPIMCLFIVLFAEPWGEPGIL